MPRPLPDRRHFGFDDFRPLSDGAPLREEIVTAGMANGPLLGILPTGFGKSICFQLPALIRFHRRSAPTVVISPLQSLMKDQVDNLKRVTDTPADGAIYGLLTGPWPAFSGPPMRNDGTGSTESKRPR
jgi:ATP-dependent DNA helicase RecQ